MRLSGRGAKMRTPHIVPLSRQAIALLKQIQELSGHLDLVFPGDHNPYKPMSENTTNRALRLMGYDTKTEICGHGLRAMACSALVESDLWSRDTVERQMSHQERNSVRAAYVHKAEHLEARKAMMQWWSDYLDVCREGYVAPYIYAWQHKAACGFAPLFPDTCYHLTHYWPAAADIPVASDNPVHYADAIRYNARTPLQGSLLPLTRLV